MTEEQRRRPEDCIGEMLRAVYGEVHQRYRIDLSTKPDDYVGKPFHDSLTSIYSILEKHRGFTDFVKRQQVFVDFFIPNPGFIVECDESQHFTQPRKISLEMYPEGKKTGYVKEKWISRCDDLDKHDNDPPWRDETRAWYDTLRDFLPEIKGFQPTVRLYAEEMEWCRMDPTNVTDIQEFKNFIDSKRDVKLSNKSNELQNSSQRQNWVATVTLETKSGKEPWLNPERIKDLNIIVTRILKEIPGDGIILFPAGFFNKGGHRIDYPFYQEISASIRSSLSDSSANIVIVAGIDGYQDAKKNDRDQVAFAIDKKNILAVARKHFPTKEDIKFGLVKSEFSDLECEKTRFFTLNDTRYYIAVCNDINAGHRGKITTDQTFDIILNPIHKFEKGDSIADFVRKGMGLESDHWDCPVFGSVKFINSSTISEIWKAGVYWGFGSGITTKTSGTDTEKFAIPGKKIPIIDLPGGDRAVVEIFTDIHSQCNIIRKNLGGFLEKPSPKKHVPTVNLDTYHPIFGGVIEVYKQMAGSNFRKGGTSSKENYIVKIKRMPPGVLYYFYHFPKLRQFSVELNVNRTRAPLFASTIHDLNHKKFVQLPNPTFKEQKTKDGIWLRLQFLYPDDATPLAVVQGMFDLIEQSYPDILRDEQRIQGIRKD